MARLIDADKLESSLNETVDAAIKWHEDCLGEIMQNRSEAAIMAFIECILRLKEQPTVDAVEVVSCKDCKWFGDFGCAIRIVDDSDKPTENDFCSFAERRTDGSDRQAGGD